MGSEITGKPELMKQMNMTLLYRALVSLRTATRAELAEETRISATTVRSLIEELERSGEIELLELDQSSGGRRAQRYALSNRCNLILSLYFERSQISYQVFSLTGEALCAGEQPFTGESTFQEILRCIEDRRKDWDIRAVGLGVPGIVENGCYYINGGGELWNGEDIGAQAQQALGLPVQLENDLNAIAFGYALRYVKEHPDCEIDSINMAYIHFNEGCSGAGIICDGRVVRGARRFAGELGFLPLEPGETADSLLQSASSREEALDTVLRVISVVNCVTNPALVVVGGEQVKNGRLDGAALSQRAASRAGRFFQPEIRVCTDWRADYLAGLFYLTRQWLLPRLPL